VDIEHYRSYCLSKKGVTEEFPFGDDVLVFKVVGKMFALTNLPDFESINLKVEPEVGEELRERYLSVQPGYHMNKKHWITVLIDGSISDKLIREWTDNSYNLVVSGLTKAQQATLIDNKPKSGAKKKS
jgi:predicted DNA-binding protein (MmcQ/YjbR family)